MAHDHLRHPVPRTRSHRISVAQVRLKRRGANRQCMRIARITRWKMTQGDLVLLALQRQGFQRQEVDDYWLSILTSLNEERDRLGRWGREYSPHKRPI